MKGDENVERDKKAELVTFVMKKMDIQALGLFMTIIGIIIFLNAPSISFNPINIGAGGEILSVIGMVVFYLGYR